MDERIVVGWRPWSSPYCEDVEDGGAFNHDKLWRKRVQRIMDNITLEPPDVVELEARGEIEPQEERVGADGKTYSSSVSLRISPSKNLEAEDTKDIIDPFETWFSDHVICGDSLGVMPTVERKEPQPDTKGLLSADDIVKLAQELGHTVSRRQVRRACERKWLRVASRGGQGRGRKHLMARSDVEEWLESKG